MDIAILNFKRFEDRAPVGFLNFAVCGLVTTDFKAFAKAEDNNYEMGCLGGPTVKCQDKDGTNQLAEGSPGRSTSLEAPGFTRAEKKPKNSHLVENTVGNHKKKWFNSNNSITF